MGSLFGAAVLFAEPSTLVSNHPLKNLMAQGEIHFLPGEAKLRGAFTWDVPEEDNEASFVLYPNRYLARQNTGVQPDREIFEGFVSEIANYELSNLNNHGSLVVERVELGSGPEREENYQPLPYRLHYSETELKVSIPPQAKASRRVIRILFSVYPPFSQGNFGFRKRGEMVLSGPVFPIHRSRIYKHSVTFFEGPYASSASSFPPSW